MAQQIGAARMRHIGKRLGKELDGLGFALFVFEFHKPGVAESRVLMMCKKLGIEPLEEKPAVKKTSALAGLSTFTMPEANHYTDLKGVKWNLWD